VTAKWANNSETLIVFFFFSFLQASEHRCDKSWAWTEEVLWKWLFERDYDEQSYVFCVRRVSMSNSGWTCKVSARMPECPAKKDTCKLKVYSDKRYAMWSICANAESCHTCPVCKCRDSVVCVIVLKVLGFWWLRSRV
jgi:hypothetical protein